MEGFEFDLPELSSVPVTCPHCGREEVDDFEVFDVGAVQAMHCDACGADHHFVLMECPHCGDESAFHWKHPPQEHELTRLACERCGRRYAEAEAAMDDASGER